MRKLFIVINIIKYLFFYLIYFSFNKYRQRETGKKDRETTSNWVYFIQCALVWTLFNLRKADTLVGSWSIYRKELVSGFKLMCLKVSGNFWLNQLKWTAIKKKIKIHGGRDEISVTTNQRHTSFPLFAKFCSAKRFQYIATLMSIVCFKWTH